MPTETWADAAAKLGALVELPPRSLAAIEPWTLQHGLTLCFFGVQCLLAITHARFPLLPCSHEAVVQLLDVLPLAVWCISPSLGLFMDLADQRQRWYREDQPSFVAVMWEARACLQLRSAAPAVAKGLAACPPSLTDQARREVPPCLLFSPLKRDVEVHFERTCFTLFQAWEQLSGLVANQPRLVAWWRTRLLALIAEGLFWTLQVRFLL